MPNCTKELTIVDYGYFKDSTAGVHKGWILYSNGFTEQWGREPSNGTNYVAKDISLPVEMQTPYDVFKTFDGGGDRGEAFNWAWFSDRASNQYRTNNIVKISIPNSLYVNGAFWNAKGYASVGETPTSKKLIKYI